MRESNYGKIGKSYLNNSNQIIMKNGITLLFLLLLVQTGFCCSCIGENSVKEEVKRSDLVIVGKILSRDEITLPRDENNSLGRESERVSFRVLVTSRYKGKIQSDTVTIITGFGGGDCGVRFKVGESYIIYAVEDIFIGYGEHTKMPNTFETNSCTRTGIAEEAELASLKKIKKPGKG